MNFYNEFDPKAAAWLRELVAAGVIPAGDVDERPIQEIEPDDLKGYTQCHFFAGIGGWPYALRLAGWPEDRPVWTGSCPCQPFSCAGKGRGVEDERHLFPVWAKLIGKCRPATVFGEQVASKAGREWLNGVFAEMEGMGYRVAGADLCAAGVGAPHIRQRLWWVAYFQGDGLEGGPQPRVSGQRVGAGQSRFRRCCPDGGVADYDSEGREGRIHGREDSGREDQHGHAGCGSATHWSASYLLPCRDGKARRVPLEPAFFPLAARIPGRVHLLRGAGDSIVPPLAAEFIKAYCEIIQNSQDSA